MFDIKLIREDLQRVKDGLAAKNIKVDLSQILADDEVYRQELVKLDDLRSKKNSANDEISQALKNKQDPKDKIAAMKAISAQIDELEPSVKELGARIKQALIGLPNLPHDTVPVGGEDQNQEVRTWGEPTQFDFKPKSHIEIAERLDIIDFKRARKISGANFILYKREGAQLERALFNFMLDVHTREHGYTEIFPPVLVNADSMTGTGQLPKMEEDMYKMKDDELYLIPTAEVPVTNIHRDEVIKADELPIYYTAYSSCFRREAGSYGKDTRGMIRVHQFNKVELVKFVEPATSYDELEQLLNNAEKIFHLLKIPYRVLLLASGDISFAAAKCYDIEAHAPGMDMWLEVSSCSNFESFQARRANIRYKGGDVKKPTYLHTLNGSGVALPRCMIAILENYQTAEGDVIIPEVLRPYMGGLEKISRS